MTTEDGRMAAFLQKKEVRQVVDNVSREETLRKSFQPERCEAFAGAYTAVRTVSGFKFKKNREAEKQLPDIIDNPVQQIYREDAPAEDFKEKYCRKQTIGIVFSGGPAPGGHNVIAGLFDAARAANPETVIYGFILGPDGVIEGEAVEITPEMVNNYRNTGGFSMIKTGRTKIDTQEKMALSKTTCAKYGLNALVIVGGDDSNTNAAFLAQAMLEDGVQVIGVPKTIDGDIQVRDDEGRVLCAMSFGFHSAARGFARQISNLCTDCSSDVKYWHVCKVMGRVASHLALEVALQTHANITLIGEDLADYVDQRRLDAAEKAGTIDYTAYGMTLRHLSRVICDAIVRRAAVGKNYGVIVIPEGVLEFINEIQVFIIKLNTIIGEYNYTHDTDFHTDFLLLEDKLDYLRRLARRSREEADFSVWNTRDDDLFNDIPPFFQEGLLMERDSHGNFPFSQVETERVIMELVTDYLERLIEQGEYKIGIKNVYYVQTMQKAGMDPDYYGPFLFRNWGQDYLLFHVSMISLKTLTSELTRQGAILDNEKVPGPIEKLFKKSIPKFKTQYHFYGYDGRGNDPTTFDCTYTYNLGMTVFSLIANGATGQMAAIKNLEKGFAKWVPLGIPIAPLMHLEERKGRLELVLEKSLVDVRAPAFQAVKALRAAWLCARSEDDHFRKPAPISLEATTEEDRPLTLTLNAFADEFKQANE
ncbi:6-phosphofructokinase [Desulfosudis oleivorans]|uniref:Phosphofructokinase n=1 Tax=Desulfosudis oleivorans (strain DSM 6200 / JCM 39069 / Hxd3) TaxID=96561 RepID=A9A0J8_DESOH|nr:6-phosphofructokinase [Desulfosudis oleivorans]ABW67498.1 phosphofructokinase [Desulfosudis oleivorans Hxd3]